jgi:hypothetical protein
VRRTQVVGVAALLIALASSCGDDGKTTSSSSASTNQTTASATSTTQTPASGAVIEPTHEPFDPKNFSNPTNIDNPHYPLQPGSQWVYEGVAIDKGSTVNRHFEFTVTDLTKEIAGVRTVVAWITDKDNGVIVEKEVAFYAQDDDGNVWYFGEHPEEYEGGRFVTAPTWIAGILEARPGIQIRRDPQVGGPSYYEGWGPAVDWTDFATVDQVGTETCVPAACYKDVTVIAESSLKERDIFQLKYYARGVGEVRTGYRGADPSQEELQLIRLVQLDATAMTDVRLQALDLEKHAYEVSKDVYALTPPSQQR